MARASTRQCRVSPLRFTRVDELDESACSQCEKSLEVGRIALIRDDVGGAMWCRTECAETYQTIRNDLCRCRRATQLDLPLGSITRVPPGFARIATQHYRFLA